jgi:hypothetical protein
MMQPERPALCSGSGEPARTSSITISDDANFNTRLMAFISAEVENVVKRELNATMQGLKEWMLENLGPQRFRTEDTQANASQTEDAGDGGLFMDGTEEYIIDGTGGSESRGGTGGSESRGGTGGQAPESIVSTESEKFPNSPEVKSFNSLLAVRNDKMEELKDLLAQHADPNMAKKVFDRHRYQ